MKITEDLRKFIESEWGQKVLRDALQINAQYFTFAKKKIPMRFLKMYIK